MGEDFSVESQGKFLQEIAAEVQLGEVREGGEGGDVGNLGKRRGGEGEGAVIFTTISLLSHQTDRQLDRQTDRRADRQTDTQTDRQTHTCYEDQ